MQSFFLLTCAPFCYIACVLGGLGCLLYLCCVGAVFILLCAFAAVVFAYVGKQKCLQVRGVQLNAAPIHGICSPVLAALMALSPLPSVPCLTLCTSHARSGSACSCDYGFGQWLKQFMLCSLFSFVKSVSFKFLEL